MQQWQNLRPTWSAYKADFPCFDPTTPRGMPSAQLPIWPRWPAPHLVRARPDKHASPKRHGVSAQCRAPPSNQSLETPPNWPETAFTRWCHFITPRFHASLKMPTIFLQRFFQRGFAVEGGEEIAVNPTAIAFGWVWPPQLKRRHMYQKVGGFWVMSCQVRLRTFSLSITHRQPPGAPMTQP